VDLSVVESLPRRGRRRRKCGVPATLDRSPDPVEPGRGVVVMTDIRGHTDRWSEAVNQLRK
jgi:hypothetical protein